RLLEAQSNERLQALLKISNTLGRTFEEEQIISQIADILTDIFKRADRCFVIFRSTNTGKLYPAVTRSRSPLMESTVLFSSTIVEKVLESGDALLFDASKIADDSDGDPKSAVESRIRSAIVAPLIDHDDRAFGLIQLDVHDITSVFTSEDLGLLVVIANQAALALENARLHKLFLSAAKIEQEMQTARLMQRSILPAKLPVVEGYQFQAYYQPARNVGGDYYDFVPDA